MAEMIVNDNPCMPHNYSRKRILRGRLELLSRRRTTVITIPLLNPRFPQGIGDDGYRTKDIVMIGRQITI
jgi:hypothetical protein